MNYKIGQVLYVLLNKETKICPVQVIEEITKKTLDGATTNYIVKVGKKGEVVSLSDMDGQVYESIEVLRKVLQERITRTVENVISATAKRAAEWYVQPSPHEENRQSNVETRSLEELEFNEKTDDAVITLPDGTIARMRGPFPGM